MVSLGFLFQGLEHEVPKNFGHSLPLIDLVFFGYDVKKLLDIQRKANEEVVRRLHCKN